MMMFGGVGALALGALRYGPCGCIAGFLVGLTTMVPALVSLASPQITSTLFFFIRNWTPLFILTAMPRERFTTASRSALNEPSRVRP
jgi:hypothetical protein